MRFVKYHGLGNDFIVLMPEGPFTLSPELARDLCARGFGVGADGVMLASPPTDPAHADVRMDLVNSDGSLPEMCGNGLRCLVKHAVDVLGLDRNPLRVETPAGVLACAWTADDRGVATVSVAMIPPRFDAPSVPVAPAHLAVLADSPLSRLDLAGRAIEGIAVNTGNPHFAIFGDASRERALSDGPALERHPAFPLKANIEFVEVLGRDHLRVTVWERGCGLTLACGTGATASTAAAVRLGLADPDRPVAVDLPGGRLAITIAADFSTATMVGPATRVFTGDIDLPPR